MWLTDKMIPICFDSSTFSWSRRKKVLTNGLKKEGVTKKEFRCEECGRNFPAKQNLGTHMRRYHKTEILVCPVPGCNKTYKHRLVLLRMIFVFSISIFVLRVENYISG